MPSIAMSSVSLLRVKIDTKRLKEDKKAIQKSKTGKLSIKNRPTDIVPTLSP